MLKKSSYFLAAFVGLYFLVMLFFALSKYWGNIQSIHDIAHFSQTVWAFTEFGTPYSTLSPPHDLHNRLGFHFSPIIYLLSPIYLLFGPEGLIASHIFFISITAFIVFRIAKELGHNENFSLAFAAIFLLNPFVMNALFWDFMEISLGVFFCSLTTLFLLQKDKFKFLLMLPLLLATKEQFGVTIAGFGILWMAYNKDIKFSALLFAFGLAMFYLIFTKLMPSLRGSEGHVMLSGDGMLSRYAWLNNGLDGLQQYLASFKTDFSLWLYLPMLFLFFLFLPLLGIWFLAPAGADILVNMLPMVNLARSVFSYHSAIVAFFFLVSTMYVMRKNLPRKDLLIFALILVNLIAATALNPMTFRDKLSLWQQKDLVNFYDPHIDEIKHIIGKDSKIAAYKNIGGYFADRLGIYPYPDINPDSDMYRNYVKVFDDIEFIIINSEINSIGNFEESFFYRDVLSKDPAEEIEKLLQDERFKLIYDENNWKVFKKVK